MLKYLKKFKTLSQYNAYAEDTVHFITPNVSLIEETNGVAYHPYIPETRVVAKYNVTDTSSPTKIVDNNYISSFSSIEIDGVEQPSVVNVYTFDITDEHTVKYTLTDPTIIDEYVFYGCNSLTSIYIPDSVTSIGRCAFYGCNSLTSINIPSSVTTIGNSAFQNCISLISIDIPDSITSISAGTFRQCFGLTSIIIPSSVTSIGDIAFFNCTSLTSVTIGSGVTSIGDRAFYQCSGLTSITVDNNNTNYSSEDGVLFDKTKTTLIQYPIGNTRTSYDIPSGVTSIDSGAFWWCNLTSIDIPSGVTSIGEDAFRQCYELTSIIIPSSVTSIDSSAFFFCPSLTSITVEATTPPTLTDTYVFDSTNDCPIYVPSGSVDTYKEATNWSEYASRIQAKP